MRHIKPLLVALLFASTSCVGLLSEPDGFGGNPVPVEINIASIRNGSDPTPGDGQQSVRAWILNTSGLKAMGGRSALTRYSTILEQGSPAESQSLREELVGDLNQHALTTISKYTETVNIEAKLHTIVVEDGKELTHKVIDVARLDFPYKFDF